MEHGLCKYSLVGLVGISIVLCNIKTIPKEYVQLGYKIGGLGMSMLRSKFDYSDMKSRVDHSYSYVLQHTDPVQKCAERARKVGQKSISSGMIFCCTNSLFILDRLGLRDWNCQRRYCICLSQCEWRNKVFYLSRC